MNFYSRTKLLIDKVITRSKYKCDIKASQNIPKPSCKRNDAKLFM